MDYPVTNLPSSDNTKFIDAELFLFIGSYDHTNGVFTTILRSSAGDRYSYSKTGIHSASATNHNSSNTTVRSFELATVNDGSNVKDAVRIYEMIVLPGEYMTDDRSAYPTFAAIEDYIIDEYMTFKVASVGAPKDLLFDDTTNTLSFGLESVTASEVEDAEVYAMVSTRDLYHNTYANDLDGFNAEIATIQDSLTPILTVSAGETVATTSYQAQSEYQGWMLINRDVASSLKSGEIQNIGSFADSGIFESSYSILGDLKEGAGDMADEYVKSGGKYKFRLIPYKSADTALEPDNTTRYLEWTQTNNPTTTATITGFADMNHNGGTFGGTSSAFTGLRVGGAQIQTWRPYFKTENEGFITAWDKMLIIFLIR